MSEFIHTVACILKIRFSLLYVMQSCSILAKSLLDYKNCISLWTNTDKFIPIVVPITANICCHKLLRRLFGGVLCIFLKLVFSAYNVISFEKFTMYKCTISIMFPLILFATNVYRFMEHGLKKFVSSNNFFCGAFISLIIF